MTLTNLSLVRHLLGPPEVGRQEQLALRNAFYPTTHQELALRVLFSPMVSGWAGGRKKFVGAVSQKRQGIGS